MAPNERFDQRLDAVVFRSREDRHVLLIVLAAARKQLDDALEHTRHAQATDAERVLALRHLVLDVVFALHETVEDVGHDVDAVLP